jgi:hypothetical protein
MVDWMRGDGSLWLRDLVVSVTFAIIPRDTFCFTVDEDNRDAFRRGGTAPFNPFPDRLSRLRRCPVPADVPDDPDTPVEWARGASWAARAGENARRRPPRGRTTCR